MNFSQFFIQRPIFAAVLSLLILIGGAISLFQLPISEYPEVVPPTVVVRATFPGANPKVIGETVASPLEQAITGVEGMLYMSSQGTADGKMTLTLTFALGTDLDKAQVQVQNRVTRTMPTLPTEVQRLGVTVDKASPDLTMVVHLTSPDDRYDMLYLSNYAALNVKDELARLDGVGDVQLFGLGNYSLRVWLDPNKVASRGLAASDVVNAIREQNRQVAAGSLGAPPSDAGNSFQLSINTQGRLVSEEEFENIIIRAGENGEITRLKDIARIELGSSQYALRSLLNNKPAVAIPVFQRPGSNAIEISDAVRARMAELKQSFPQGVDYEIVYDPTIFVRGSIEAVVHTLLEAIILVVLVVILFLQTWRASIIPLAAVPVSLIGTFAVMHMFGFSLNALSLFGLVLAIGIVVDDAIVVVENVERNIEAGLTPREATYRAMREVSGPIIAIALVLVAVFVPLAFISGLTGQFYRQFAATIAISTVISAFNSLTLSPALAAVLLKPHDAPKDKLARGMDWLLGGFFKRFNRVFDRASHGYQGGVQGTLKHKSLTMGAYLALCVAAFATYFLIDVDPRHNGGSWYGYTLGTIGLLLIVWLSLLGISWFWFYGATFLAQMPVFAKEVLGAQGATIVPYGTQNEIYLDVAAGRLDGTVADATLLEDGFLKTDAGKGYAFVGPAFTDAKYFGDGIGIAVRKGDKANVDRINAAIDAIRANGKYKQIEAKYFNFDIYGPDSK